MKCYLIACMILAALLMVEAADKSRKEPCVNGGTHFDGCNNCVCSDGVWGCTLKFCPEGYLRKTREVGECKEGEQKQEQCNKCWCSKTGLWVCTRIACNKKREAIAAGSSARWE